MHNKKLTNGHGHTAKIIKNSYNLSYSKHKGVEEVH
jgi:hypothetical protein